MHKRIAFGLAIVMAVGYIGAAARAQDATLPIGEWVTGELTEGACTVVYTIQPDAGDLILVEMLRNTDTMDLDPAMMITDSAGKRVAFADDTEASYGAAP